MTEFLGNMYSWFTFIPKITLSNLFEILILTVLIYEVLLWVKSTRAGVLLRGGMIIVGFYLLAAMFHLNTITWIINHMGQLVLTALIIIFQPELRKALEQLGSKNIITDLFISENSRLQEGYTEKTVNEITRAAFEMGKVKTGALIVIERDTPLPEIERTGIPVDGLVTSQLLINIFEHIGGDRTGIAGRTRKFKKDQQSGRAETCDRCEAAGGDCIRPVQTSEGMA